MASRQHVIFYISVFLMLFAGSLFAQNDSLQYWKADDAYLMARYKIISDRGRINPRNLSGYVQQQPNNKFLGLFRLGTGFYKMGSKGKDTRFKRFLRERIGEEPVILDTTLTSASCHDMVLYLNNIGYFYSEVNYEVKYRRKKAIVHFYLKTADPYRYNDIQLYVEDTKIDSIVRNNKSKSLFKTGDIYNVYTLDRERDRISRLLKNNGYYFFSKDFISYQIDSNLMSKKMNVDMYVENVKKAVPGYPDSVISSEHKSYLINDIFIHTGLEPGSTSEGASDTLVFYSKTGKEDSVYAFDLIYDKQIKFKPQAVSNAIFFKKGSLYRLKEINETNRRLSAYPITRMVSIRLTEVNTHDTVSKQGFLNCDIFINRSPVNSFSVETDVTNSAGNPGMAASVTYQNKNIFKRGEVLRIKVRGALELQTSAQNTERFFFFNTAETGFEASILFPRFLLPVRTTSLFKYFKPKTSLITSLNWQLRPDYTRYMINGSFGYNWEPSDQRHHAFYPVDIQSVKIFPDDSSSFFKYIEESGDLRLKEQYTDHLIMAMRYNYIFTNQVYNRPVNFIYLNLNAESAGNLLYGATSIAGSVKNENDKYTLFDIPYAQYVKTNIDLRFYNYFEMDNLLVFRGYFGIGLPYGNSEALPYEKGYFAGGANDMRGWEYRRLGPGSYNLDTLEVFDRMGDVKLLGNIEYRFGVFRWFKGAFFIDAGNIWLLSENEDWPGGEFKFNSFMNQMAVNAGVGFRFDFNFFIFRIDYAATVRDPAFEPGDRYVFMTPNANSIWNFGIGYPF